MIKLSFELADEIAEKVQQLAQAESVTTSYYLVNLLQQHLNETWPEAYFETVIGGWQGDLLVGPIPLIPEERDPFN